MLIKKENIANYSKLGPWTPEDASDPNPPVSIPDLNTVPPNYESIIGDNLDAAGREKNLSNREALTSIENKAKALEQKLPTIDSDIIRQLSFSGDSSKLRDCMVLVLYSPASNENPNLSNSPLEITSKVAQGWNQVGSAIGEFSDGLQRVEPGEGEELSITDKFKNKGIDFTQSVVGSVRKFDETNEITNNQIERLNKNFYTEGNANSGNKRKTIFLPLPKQINDIHSHNVDAFTNNPIIPIAGIVSGALNSISGAFGGGKQGGIQKYTQSGMGDYIFNNLQLATRKAFNPAVETLYRSPNPRNWQWNIEFQPTSKEEADNFIKIIEMLKQHSYPTQDFGGILYTFPGTIDFYFRINGEESKVLPKSLQKCFLKSVQLDYTQQGFYAHFKDGNPVTITLTLDIAETRLLDRNDLENASSYNDSELRDSLDMTGLTKEQVLRPYKTTPQSGRPD